MGAKMPAILVEVGFLSNEVEGRRLTEATHQAKVVKSLAAGIAAFLEARDPKHRQETSAGARPSDEAPRRIDARGGLP